MISKTTWEKILTEYTEESGELASPFICLQSYTFHQLWNDPTTKGYIQDLAHRWVQATKPEYIYTIPDACFLFGIGFKAPSRNDLHRQTRLDFLHHMIATTP